MKSERGFTLLELLVVIAIIGVLAAIVMAALGSSRTKSSDAAIRRQNGELRSQMALYYAANGNYGPTYSTDDCTDAGSSPNTIFYTDPKIKELVNAAVKLNGGSPPLCSTGGSNPARADSWAFASPLTNEGVGGNYWCVDSNGTARQVSIPSDKYFAFSGNIFANIALAGLAPPLPDLGGGNIPAVCP